MHFGSAVSSFRKNDQRLIDKLGKCEREANGYRTEKTALSYALWPNVALALLCVCRDTLEHLRSYLTIFHRSRVPDSRFDESMRA